MGVNKGKTSTTQFGKQVRGGGGEEGKLKITRPFAGPGSKKPTGKGKTILIFFQ